MSRLAAHHVRERSREIADVLTLETGKPIRESRLEVMGGAAILDFVAGAAAWGWRGEIAESKRAGTLVYTRRSPLGVVAIVTPWNFPLSNPCIKLASALIAGNSVIWKPATWSPGCALELSQCLVDADLPPGVLTTVLGNGDVIGTALVGDHRVAAVSFTGSTQVGMGIAPILAARGATYQLEMGGKNAAVVLDDADVDRAAAVIASAAFSFAGQKCTATSRVIATKGVAERLRQALVAAAEAMKVGDPTSEETDVGPVISERHLSSHLAAVDSAREEGGRALTVSIPD